MSTSSGSSAARPSWSNQFADRFHLTLEPSLADWLDNQCWKASGASEFCHPVTPDVLLVDEPDVIWPGLMLPDTLPLIGNRNGDWLCLRCGADDTVAEIIHWYHGGGDWIPWGRTMAEALFFDSARHALPGRRQQHAIAATDEHAAKIPTAQSNEQFDWAVGWLPEPAAGKLGGKIPADWTSSTAVSEIAACCELTLEALDSRLRQQMTAQMADDLGVSWEPDVISWMFDNRLVPPEGRAALRNQTPITEFDEQNWELASQHARRVAQQRDDLVWAFDIAGWHEESTGNIEAAARLYQQGVFALAFADQSIRFRSHWFPQWSGKFSTWRLCQLRESGRWSNEKIDPAVREYLDVVANSEAARIRSSTMHHWHGKAVAAIADSRWSDAYQGFYRAGWDLGTEHMIDYGDLLSGLAASAERAGQQARAAIAQTHLNVFNARFGQ
jgi:hypothetical protein